ncbi:MAG TPA: DUF2089 domain-containing protein [Caldilineaceae bacterium]|nr:DUF2089 domain-containing protein [Caldilineaceae bacterium]HRW09659.1 DUF2089 domain-containing protein [Caldilineaceae bacterium]
MRKVLEQCPSCGGELEITRVNCTRCETVVSGRYQPCRFCKLPPESVQFLEAFVKNRGNVKEMERELGISYWTIRTRLNELIEELGFEVDNSAEAEREEELKKQRRTILEQIDRGELSATEAAAQLTKLKG